MNLKRILLKKEPLTEREYSFLANLLDKQVGWREKGYETLSNKEYKAIFNKLNQYTSQKDLKRYSTKIDGLMVKESLTEEDYTFIKSYLRIIEDNNNDSTTIRYVNWSLKVLQNRELMLHSEDIVKDMSKSSLSLQEELGYITNQQHKELLTIRDLDKTDINNHNMGIYTFLPKVWKDKLISVRSRINSINRKATSFERPPMIDKFKESYPYFWFVKEDERKYAQKLVEDLYIKGQEDPELLDLYKLLKQNTPFVTDFMIDGEHDNFIRSKHLNK